MENLGVLLMVIGPILLSSLLVLSCLLISAGQQSSDVSKNSKITYSPSRMLEGSIRLSSKLSLLISAPPQTAIPTTLLGISSWSLRSRLKVWNTATVNSLSLSNCWYFVWQQKSSELMSLPNECITISRTDTVLLWLAPSNQPLQKSCCT